MSRPEEMEARNEGPEKLDITLMMNDFFRILRKNLILLVLITAIGAAGFGFFQKYTYVPTYTASVTYVINTSPEGVSGNYYDISAARQLAETFPYIITSDVLQRQTAKVLETEQVPGEIRAEVMENTNFLTVSVKDQDPDRAHRTLQAVVEIAPKISEVIIGKVYSELMDETGVPSGPDNPFSMKQNLLKGGLLGLLLGLVIQVAVMLTSRTVRCEEDCLNRINIRCMGVVPRVKEKVRSKKKETHLSVMRKNADPEFVEAFRIIRNKVDQSTRKYGYKSLLVTSTLAGEGKSTIAVNLALSLAQEGKQVALVDCDLRNPSDGAILEVPKGPGLINFLRDEERLENCTVLCEELYQQPLHLLFVRGGQAVQDGSVYLSTDKMKLLIQALEQKMDCVILDTPPAGLLTDAGILAQHADAAVFVVKKDFAKADKILEGMEHLTQSSIEILGCVLNGDE